MAATILPSTSSNRIQPPRHKIAFISGPLEPEPTYFDQYYTKRIDEAIVNGHSFILGPSYGIDTIARTYLLARVAPVRIAIYLYEKEAITARRRFKAFEEAGGRVVIAGRNHTARDEAMTRASHYDILRYRTEEECREIYGTQYRRRVSGTEKNEIRRKAGVGLVWTEPSANPADLKS
ncbi:hypothetical protein Hypma_008245 [Hypsizygus marmoreus]|uniref:Uncharacterized protein n=1 Tax=Hypsizygus marmoreus TaxID=39966 RepID=A0A369JYX7_HYPMA|nr:hypothetical protein Hypma_008245 [Hypsizygus marmoreus]